MARPKLRPIILRVSVSENDASALESIAEKGSTPMAEILREAIKMYLQKEAI